MAGQEKLDLDGGFPQNTLYHTCRILSIQRHLRVSYFYAQIKTIAPKQDAILIRIMYRNFNERI